MTKKELIEFIEQFEESSQLDFLLFNQHYRIAKVSYEKNVSILDPSTKIKYAVPQSSKVKIMLYNILGNEIETLVDEDKSADTYEVTWHAKNLPSGVYIYRLQAGDYSETKKMLLLK